MIANRLELIIGDAGFLLTDDTTDVEAVYVQEWADRGDPPVTVHRPDGQTFQAVTFPAGTFHRERSEYDPDIDGWKYYGVRSNAGWYVIDPERTQPATDARPTTIMQASELPGVEPDDGRGLFIPRLSAVADSFKRLFGG